MRSLIVEFVSQRGPMGPHMDQTSSILAVSGLFAVLLIVALMLLFFPRLGNVKSTGAFRPEVESLGGDLDEGGTKDAMDLGTGRAMEVALRLLEPDERRVVEALAAEGGSMLQKDITYELGFSRVKTHRVLVRLLKRGVVTAEKYYNTNRIELAGWLTESRRP